MTRIDKLLGASCRRLLLFRPLQLGDMLCAIPALRSFRSSFPDAEIALVGLPWAREFTRRFSHYVDRLFIFPGHPGMPERNAAIHEFPRFLRRLHDYRADAAIQLHGNGQISNSLVTLFGARLTAGFSSPASYCPDPRLFFPYPGGHEVHRLLGLAEFLGCKPSDARLEFPLAVEEQERGRSVLEGAGLRSLQYICIHGGARAAERRWPAEKFAAVAAALHSTGHRIVLTGTREERGIAEEIAGSLDFPVVNLAGMTELGELAVVLKGARLLLANDTGVSHIAAALQTPSVILFTASERDRWAPLERERHLSVVASEDGVSDRVIHLCRRLIEKESREVAYAA